MPAFTTERRRADPGRLMWTGPDRRKSRDANRDPISGAPGAVVGGLAGKGVAEMIDPTAEEAYWRENYAREPYYERGYMFDDYHPGYRIGWEARARCEARTFDEVERELEMQYNRNRGTSQLGWDKNRHAARAAWERFDEMDQPEKSQ
jgi:hypothetical protein